VTTTTTTGLGEEPGSGRGRLNQEARRLSGTPAWDDRTVTIYEHITHIAFAGWRLSCVQPTGASDGYL
jgi:hypothetical protein